MKRQTAMDDHPLPHNPSPGRYRVGLVRREDPYGDGNHPVGSSTQARVAFKSRITLPHQQVIQTGMRKGETGIGFDKITRLLRRCDCVSQLFEARGSNCRF